MKGIQAAGVGAPSLCLSPGGGEIGNALTPVLSAGQALFPQLSPVKITLTLALSHQGRGDRAGCRALLLAGEGPDSGEEEDGADCADNYGVFEDAHAVAEEGDAEGEAVGGFGERVDDVGA